MIIRITSEYGLFRPSFFQRTQHISIERFRDFHKIEKPIFVLIVQLFKYKDLAQRFLFYNRHTILLIFLLVFLTKRTQRSLGRSPRQQSPSMTFIRFNDQLNIMPESIPRCSQSSFFFSSTLTASWHYSLGFLRVCWSVRCVNHYGFDYNQLNNLALQFLFLSAEAAFCF